MGFASLISLRLCRRLIDFGVDIVGGTGPHATLGIEVYKEKPIVYGAGDFMGPFPCIFDRCDLGFIFQAKLDKEGISHLELVPLCIKGSQATLATGAHQEQALGRMQYWSYKMGTPSFRHKGRLVFPCRVLKGT